MRNRLTRLYFTNEQLGHLERERRASRAAGAAVARFGRAHTPAAFSVVLPIVVLAANRSSGAGALQSARALAAPCEGTVSDERGTAIDQALERTRTTLLVVPSPQPGNGHWLGRYAELVVRCCAAPVLFIPELTEGATS